jgi:RecA-family ATPase
MAVSIASGRELLGEKVRGGNDLKVLLINGEDSGTEIMRRVWAFYLAHAHKIPGQNLDRLYVAGADDARVQRLSFLRTTDKNLSALDQSGFKVLEAALELLRPDVFMLDPLVAFITCDITALSFMLPTLVMQSRSAGPRPSSIWRGELSCLCR